MTIIRRVFAFLTSFLLGLLGTTGFTVGQRAANLRVTAYIIADSAAMMEAVDESHFSALTDIILIGSLARFDKDGVVRLCPDFGRIVDVARAKIGEEPVRLHLNVFGPGALAGETFEEQMYSQGEEHKKAFASGVLEENLRAVLEEYGLDGIFFDYEFPVAQEHKEAFGAFLVSLRKTLGDDYVLGAAESAWCAGLPKAAIRSLDMVEVMCYDLWDDDGTHSSLGLAQNVMKDMRKHGYKRSQLDMGIPFYARPTTQEAYWYDYAGYYDKMDENGFALDESTGLVASFNTPAVVEAKTDWVIRKGYGGVMVWHYRCDLPADNEASLFNAVLRARENAADTIS